MSSLQQLPGTNSKVITEKRRSCDFKRDKVTSLLAARRRQLRRRLLVDISPGSPPLMGLNKQSKNSSSKTKSKSKKQNKKGLFSPPAKDGLSGASLVVSSPPPPVSRASVSGSGPAIEGTVAPEIAKRVIQEQSKNFWVAEEVTIRSGSGNQKSQNLIPEQTQKPPTETPKLVAAPNKAPTQETQTSPNVAATDPTSIITIGNWTVVHVPPHRYFSRLVFRRRRLVPPPHLSFSYFTFDP
ncbi:unnamed protein product [Arabis nemorensis]|uniref:Uncharacterized protein n=1 Tax=Arabis nemorensis TaxID=586526 RepID=A0A565B2K9_9BRAS|nr:unnamed protein product [Arabis nemorensis]